MKLAEQIRAYAKLNSIDMETLGREVCVSISEDIVQNSPVDEGRFRSNWFASSGTPKLKTVKSKRRDSLKTVKREFAKAFDSGVSYYFSNNLPYARAIEYGLYKKNPKLGTKNRKTGIYEIRTRNGYSKQAPRGLIRIAIMRQKQDFRKLLNSDKIKTAGSGTKNWG